MTTLWMFFFSRTRKEQHAFDETEEELLLDACVSDSYAAARYGYTQTACKKKEKPRDETCKSAAKIILPIVGICAIGIVIFIISKKRKSAE